MRFRGFTVRPSVDLSAAATGAMVYSCALGIVTVVMPLLAVHSGYGKPAVGYLTAVSALAQILTRLSLGAVMRIYPDRWLILAAGVLLAGSSVLVAASARLPWFVLAELLQGSSRGMFWTGSQTHVVRGVGSAVGRLAVVNFISSIGLLAGPVAAGVLAAHSLELALDAAAGVAAAGCLPALLLDRLSPFERAREPSIGRLWQRPGVDMGCAAGLTAGGWRGLLSSYVPVALERAGQSRPVIGLMVSVANAASIVGAGAVARAHGRLSSAFAVSTVAAGVGTALAVFAAPVLPLETVVLAVSGIGAGALQTLGPAVATDAVGPDRRGDAIATAGTFRAVALFASPLAAGAMLGFAPLSLAAGLIGGAITLPVMLLRRQPATAAQRGRPTWHRQRAR